MKSFSDLRAEYETAGFRVFQEGHSDCDLSLQKIVRKEGVFLYHVEARLYDYQQFGGPPKPGISVVSTFYRSDEKQMRVTLSRPESPEAALSYYAEIFAALDLIPDPHNG